MDKAKSPSPDTARATPWLPVTFGGVAGLAMGPAWRFRWVRMVMAVATALCLVWFCQQVFTDCIRRAIAGLPGQGMLRDGRLDWAGPPVSVLARSSLLTLVVDLDFQGDAGQVTDWQVEFGRDSVRLRSMFGYSQVPYAREWRLEVRRDELEPWWGAWEPALLAGVAGVSLVALLGTWVTLGAAYGLGVWLYTFFLDRDVGYRACWRTAQAALLPGALVMSIAVVCGGWQRLDFLGLLFAFALHLAVPWVYLLVSPWYFPRLNSAASRNPFAAR